MLQVFISMSALKKIIKTIFTKIKIISRGLDIQTDFSKHS